MGEFPFARYPVACLHGDMPEGKGRRCMQIVYERCAGLDVHKKSVMACLITPAPNGERRKQRQTFSTMTPDLMRLRDWLKEHKCSQVAMESTGVFWKPIFNILEGHVEVMVVNAQHIKAVPGRKTDIKDAEWIADLLQHGLSRPSFIPPAWQRIVRELTRSRSSLSEERSRVIARLQKELEDANITLASVASDLMGKSARAVASSVNRRRTDSRGHGGICSGQNALETRAGGAGAYGSSAAAPSFLGRLNT